MKITQEQIKLIIKEELEKILLEGDLIDYEKEMCLRKYNACRGSDTENQECTDAYTECMGQAKDVAAKNALARKIGAAYRLQQLKQKRSEEEKRKEEERKREEKRKEEERKREEKRKEEERKREKYLPLLRMWYGSPEYEQNEKDIEEIKDLEGLAYHYKSMPEGFHGEELEIEKKIAELKGKVARKREEFFEKHKSSIDQSGGTIK